MFNQRIRISVLATLLGAAMAGVAESGIHALRPLSMPPDLGAIMAMPHAGTPKPHNGGHGRGNNARIKRAAKKRRNIRARASKRRRVAAQKGA